MRIGLEKKQLRVSSFALKLVVAVVGILALAAVAEEKPSSQVLTAVSSTTLSGYVSTSAIWKPGSTPTGQQTSGVSFLSFTNSQAQLLLTIPVGSTNTLEVSTNLVTWIPVLTCVFTNDGTGSTLSNGAFMLTHSNLVGFPLLYYRFVDSASRTSALPSGATGQTIKMEINRLPNGELVQTNLLPPLPPPDLDGR